MQQLPSIANVLSRRSCIKVLYALHTLGPATKYKLAMATGLSYTLLNKSLELLKKEKLIIEVESNPSIFKLNYENIYTRMIIDLLTVHLHTKSEARVSVSDNL